MITRIDENTGREIRQITNLPHGARMPYFRIERYLPDGRIIGLYCADDPTPPYPADVLVFDPESGDVEFAKRCPGSYLTVLNGKAIFRTMGEKREIWGLMLPDGDPELIGSIPQEIPGTIHGITCDEKNVVLVDTHLEQPADAKPFTNDVDDVGGFWRYIYRPRSGDMYTYNLENGTLTHCIHSDRFSFFYVALTPADPGLICYAQDGLAVFDQRMWAVRTDGSELRKLRPQEKGEWVHHEFLWPGGEFMGYKYVDRRNDPTIHELPWGELAPRPLQMGIADMTGQEVYLSDPLCCYQTHLYMSPKGDMISGEGTLNHSFVYAAPFSWSDHKIDLQPLATIHTPYLLSAAQGVEAGFSTDSKWLVYNDMVDGQFQIFAVKV